MNRRDLIVGVVILAILAGFIYYWKKPTLDEQLKVPQTLSVQDQIEDKFNLSIPDNVDKAELNDVSGGNASAIATREYSDGKFTATILADLPDPESGFYTSELAKDNETIATGSLILAKGGYLLEYQSSQDLSDFSTVRVKLNDKIILEGSFR
jgi:hypothetical protein